MIACFCRRGVAQLGSALLWGSRGRGFKSRRSDVTVQSFKQTPQMRGLFYAILCNLLKVKNNNPEGKKRGLLAQALSFAGQMGDHQVTLAVNLEPSLVSEQTDDPGHRDTGRAQSTGHLLMGQAQIETQSLLTGLAVVLG